LSQVPIQKSYDFEAVGRLEAEFENTLTDTVAEIPIGFKTPMEMSVGANSGPFKMRMDLAAQIKDNFRNMIATNHGDRLMLFDFGANLAELSFELGNENTDVMAINRIRRLRKILDVVREKNSGLLNQFRPKRFEVLG